MAITSTFLFMNWLLNKQNCFFILRFVSIIPFVLLFNCNKIKQQVMCVYKKHFRIKTHTSRYVMGFVLG